MLTVISLLCRLSYWVVDDGGAGGDCRPVDSERNASISTDTSVRSVEIFLLSYPPFEQNLDTPLVFSYLPSDLFEKKCCSERSKDMFNEPTSQRMIGEYIGEKRFAYSELQNINYHDLWYIALAYSG